MGSIVNTHPHDASSVTAGSAADGLVTKRSGSHRKRLVGAYTALLVFMVIYLARPEDWIPGMSHAPLAKISGILAFLALAFSIRQIRDRMSGEILFLFLLVAQLLMASIVSPVWRGGAMQETLDFSKVLVVVLIIHAAVTTIRRLRTLIWTQAVSISAIAAVAIWKGRLLDGRLEGVFSGPYGDPNDMALAITISLPLCLALLFLSKNRFWKILWASSILVMVYAVFLTGSRGGFLSLTVVSMVCLWEFAIRGRRRYLLLLAGLAGMVLWQSTGGVMIGRLKGTLNVDDDKAAAYESGQARQRLFWRSIEVTMEHPLFGVGPGNFDAVSGQWHTTHNSLTLMSSEGGLPALILYILILWCGFKNLRATKRLAVKQNEIRVLTRALFASLAGYAIGSLFLSVAYQFVPYILVAYSTVLLSIARKSAAEFRKQETSQPATAEEKYFVGQSDSLIAAGSI
jgi:hypothetical protein